MRMAQSRSRMERAGVLEAFAVVLTMAALWGAISAKRPAAAAAWRLDAARLDPAGAQLVREAGAAFAEIERGIDDTSPPRLEGAPTPSQLASAFVAPFFSVHGAAAPMTFSVVHEGEAVWYVGRAKTPSSPVGAMVLAFSQLEASSTAATDVTHHRLPGGQVIHVGLWVLPSGTVPGDDTIDADGVSHQPVGFLPSSPLVWGMLQVLPDGGVP